MTEQIRLVVIDHNTLLRRCLVSMLNRRRDFEIIGDGDCGIAALELARLHSPDIVLLEPKSDGCGPHLIQKIYAELPQTRVVALSMCCDETARECLLAGARGYVEKSCEPDDLVRGIKQVHAGELVVGSRALDSLLVNPDDTALQARTSSTLTPREIDVLRLVVEGRTNPEIARELYITEHTVKGHLARILGKLGVDNRVQLATYAIHHGIVDSPSEAANPL